jgi:hypothetical protein
MLSIMLALAGMLIGVSQTEGWTMRTTANTSQPAMTLNKANLIRPAS